MSIKDDYLFDPNHNPNTILPGVTYYNSEKAERGIFTPISIGHGPNYRLTDNVGTKPKITACNGAGTFFPCKDKILSLLSCL
jgi:hypothetical protein